MLRVDNHADQSTDFYFQQLHLFFDAPQHQYTPRLSESADTVIHLNSLFEYIRPHLFKKASDAFILIKRAISWMQCDETQLTPLHSHLCLLALKTSDAEAAIDVLSCDINSIHPCLTDAKQYLLFYYYGAILYGIRQDWERMHFYLEQVISIPAHYISQIIIDAYKKFLLVCLIRGIEPNLPKYATNTRAQQELFNPSRSLQSQAGERTSGICHIKKYMSFIKGCKSGREEKEMLSLKPILQADRNWSLAKCAIQYMVERRITNLNSIFVTIPLKDVARRVGLSSEQEAESFLQTMISNDKLEATIERNEDSNLVIFRQDTQFDEVKMQQQLDMNKKLSEVLIAKIKSLDKDIQREPKYVKKTLSEESDEKHDGRNYSKLNS